MAGLLEQIQEFLGEAEGFGHGPTQLALVERAVELADSLGDAEVAFYVRMELVEAATFAGRTDLAMIAFSWLLTKYDENPEEHDGYQLLWRYKWILENVADFPNIEKAQIEALYDDMKRRYKAEGSTLHAYWAIRRNNALIMGDATAAKKADAKLLTTPRDHLSNCPACVQDEQVEYCVFVGDDAGAIRAAKPILSGKMVCGEVPERTYADLVLPLIRLGKHERALENFRTGYRLIDRDPKFVRHKAMFLIGLTLTDNLSRAVKLLDRHLPEALVSASPWWRFEFLLAARLLSEKLAESGKKTLPIRIPEGVALEGGDGKPTVAALIAWLDAELSASAAKFDARNGNKSFAKRVRGFRKLFEYEKPCPLK